GGDLEPAVAAGLLGDRLAQRGQASGGRVAVVLGVEHGGGCCLHDVLRSAEVGLTRRVADDGSALGLQRFGLGVDLERCGLCDGGDSAGDAGEFSHPLRLVEGVSGRLVISPAPRWPPRGAQLYSRVGVTYTGAWWLKSAKLFYAHLRRSSRSDLQDSLVCSHIEGRWLNW